MIWTFRDPVTGETVRSDVPPSQYKPREPVRRPQSIRNTSPHRQNGISRNGAALPSQDNHDD